MPIRREISQEEIEPYLNRNYWGLGNQLLYDMVKQYPYHEDKDAIHAKLWLIGRAYAAPIERNKATYDKSKGDFYTVEAVPHMLKVGKELDKRIAELNMHKGIASLQELKLLLGTHAYLLREFEEKTKDNKRSLASKYLHFHAPNMVYIYDSRAEKAACKYVKFNKSLYKKLKKSATEEWDDGYARFAVRLFELQNYIQEEFGERPSPRAIDSFLLQFKYYD